MLYLAACAQHRDRSKRRVPARCCAHAAKSGRKEFACGFALLCLILGTVAYSVGATAPPASAPTADPIRVWDETRDNPPLHLHFASIDLRDPSVAVRVVRCGDDPDGAGPWETTLATVATIAQREGMDVAVNGNLFEAKDSVSVFGRKNYYFAGNWAKVRGWAMTDGQLWSTEHADASLIVDASGRVRIGRFDRIPDDARQIVSGSDLMLANGRNLGGPADLAPRTAAGVDRDGRTLVLLVVDGRRPDYSVGMNLTQLADEMMHKGCSDALNLDGGGSSTLAARDPASGDIKVVNSPSDGHDFFFSLSMARPVADVLGIFRTTRPAGKAK
jgi:hypothetical protein